MPRCLPPRCSPRLPASAATVVTADRYLDVQTGRYVEHPAIFIGDDGRITSIGDARTVRWGANVKHVDLGGKTLLPGLIDMHVHLDSPADIGGYRGLEFTDSFWAVTAVGNAKAMLDAGFTTVRNVGSGNRNDVGLAQAIRDGYAVGPRIVPAGYALGATGGHCDSTFLPPSLEKAKKEEGVGDGPEELRHQVRRQRKFGAEVIKVCATGGVFSRNTEPGQQQLSEAELRPSPTRRISGACGSPPTPMAPTASRPRSAPGSTPSSMPAWSMTRASARRGAQAAGVVLDGYLQHRIYPGRRQEERRAGGQSAQGPRDRPDPARRFPRGAWAGVRMVFGSDAGVMPHGQIGKQFATMVTYGMTPLQAIQAATRNAAEALGREQDVGAIAVGRYGDLVAVTGDPLPNVRLLERPDAVIKGGVLVPPAADRSQ